jgi:hypothetical protein
LLWFGLGAALMNGDQRGDTQAKHRDLGAGGWTLQSVRVRRRSSKADYDAG